MVLFIFEVRLICHASCGFKLIKTVTVALYNHSLMTEFGSKQIANAQK